MEYRIAHISIRQLVTMLTALYACIGVIAVPLVLVMGAADSELGGFGVVVALFLPILYAVIGALSGAIGGSLYNWFASRLGGIEIEVVGSNPLPDGPQEGPR